MRHSTVILVNGKSVELVGDEHREHLEDADLPKSHPTVIKSKEISSEAPKPPVKSPTKAHTKGA